MLTISVCQNESGIPARVQVGDTIHAGGEGHVHFSVDGRYAVKIYHPHRTRPDKRRLLERVAVIGQAQGGEDHHFLCWPLALVQEVDGVPAIGCVTRRIPTPPFVPLGHLNNSASMAEKWFKGGLDWSHLLQIARGVGRSVAVLHGRGCAHADLSNRNFLVDPTPANCDVVLIDLDGIVVPEWLEPQVKGTMGIIAPEVLAGAAEPGELSDRHSLAVQILQTLLLRNPMQPLVQLDTNNDVDEMMGWGTRAVFSEHPTNTSNRPRMLGLPFLSRHGAMSYRMLSPALQQLTYRSLVEGLHHPSKRPSARDWISALSWCLDELHQCTRCGKHYPYPHWNPRRESRSCPFCGHRTKTAGNTVFWLYEPSREGQYSLLPRHIVLAHGWSLFEDVVQPQTDPPMSRQAGNVPPVAHLEFDVKNKINRLVCDGGPSWHVQTGRDAPVKMIGRNESTSLESGTVVRFGQQGRVLVVKE